MTHHKYLISLAKVYSLDSNVGAALPWAELGIEGGDLGVGTSVVTVEPDATAAIALFADLAAV